MGELEAASARRAEPGPPAEPVSAAAAVVELELPPRADVLALARLVVAGLVSADPEFTDERLDDLRLAVSEACTNAIEAQQRAAADRSTAPITVRCWVEQGRAQVEIHDNGAGFDPRELAPHPPITDPARLDHEGGLGIPLIRLLSDAVEFRATDFGTTVAMTFEARHPRSERWSMSQVSDE
ncbi:MAG: ATP-binding protein [Actinomycetota bacterium]|nr:ATP-binding protein [Actinomycetota bacterium]